MKIQQIMPAPPGLRATVNFTDPARNFVAPVIVLALVEIVDEDFNKTFQSIEPMMILDGYVDSPKNVFTGVISVDLDENTLTP